MATESSKIYVNDFGHTFLIDCGIELDGYDEFSIFVKKPYKITCPTCDGTGIETDSDGEEYVCSQCFGQTTIDNIIEWEAVAEDDKIKYITQSGDLDEAGVYELQACIKRTNDSELDDLDLRCETLPLTVFKDFK